MSVNTRSRGDHAATAHYFVVGSLVYARTRREPTPRTASVSRGLKLSSS